MSLTKRIFREKDPAFEDVRQNHAISNEEYFKQFPFRLPTRRLPKRPIYNKRWDPLWPSCINKAARELDIETVHINDGIFFKTADQMKLVKDRATVLYEEHCR